MQPPALRFQRLTKHYGSVRVLRDIDLEIGSGEFFGLVGMNGAGKTTLIIRCVMLARSPTVAGNMRHS